MTDIILFKYRQVNRDLIESLVQSQIFFAQPESLNDPRDCQVDMAEALQRAISLADDPRRHALETVRNEQHLFNKINSDIKQFGICSFADTVLNQVLWSHYAAEHRGICLTYTFPENYVNERGNDIFGMSRVSYGDNAMTNFFLTFDFGENGMKFEDFAIEAMKKALTIKSSDWKYEGEARLIRTKPGAFDIPPEFLTQICFGLRTSSRDKALIRELARQKYSNVNFSEIRATNSDFGYEVVAI